MLDDSTDKVTRELVDEKVAEWRERGINIDCVRRTNRQGYKAGAMKEASGAGLGGTWALGCLYGRCSRCTELAYGAPACYRLVLQYMGATVPALM